MVPPQKKIWFTHQIFLRYRRKPCKWLHPTSSGPQQTRWLLPEDLNNKFYDFYFIFGQSLFWIYQNILKVKWHEFSSSASLKAKNCKFLFKQLLQCLYTLISGMCIWYTFCYFNNKLHFLLYFTLGGDHAHVWEGQVDNKHVGLVKKHVKF